MSSDKMAVNIKVEDNTVSVDADIFTTGTVNNYEAAFALPEEYNDLLIYALFNDVRCAVEDGKCILPEFKKTGTLRIGVVAYDQYSDHLIERYSPKPAYAHIVEGSYIENTKGSTESIASDYEKLLMAADNANKAAEEATLAAEDAQNTAAEIWQQAESGAFDGAPGKDGAAATVKIGSTETGEPGTPAQVTNAGTENAAILNFVIPKGEQGNSFITQITPGTQDNPLLISATGLYYAAADGYVKFKFDDENEVQATAGTYSENINIPFKVSQQSLIGYINVPVPSQSNNQDAFILDPENGLKTINRLGVNVGYIKDYSKLYYFDTSNGQQVSMEIVYQGLYTLGTALILKKDKPEILTQPTSFNKNVALNNNQEFRLQEMQQLNISVPSSPDEDFEASLIFESGATATVLSYAADTITFVGDDCDEDGDFVPQANTGYEIDVKNLGYNRIVARVGAF